MADNRFTDPAARYFTGMSTEPVSAPPPSSQLALESTLDLVRINTDRIPALGQALMSGSVPVVIASDQSPIPISGTVTATVPNPLPVSQSGTWILGANPGVDIGDVTVNNAAGAAAVNIQDGGNTITVDGTINAAQSGAWTVTANAGTNLNTSLLLLDATFTARINTLGQKAMAASTPVVIASDQSAIPVTGSLTPSGTQDVNLIEVGGVATDIGIGAAGLGTQRVAVSSDSSITANAGTNLNTSLLLLDATFTARINTQGQKAMAASTPVVIASDQSAIPASQSGAWTVTANAGTNLNTSALLLDATFTARINTLGQKTMAASTPVVIASDQSAITVTGSLTPSGTQDINLKQVGGVATDIGTGAAGLGTQRVSVSLDSSIILAAGVAEIGNVKNSGTFAVQAAQSGTWNITNISGVISLPTGASTLAEQQTQTISLQLLDDVVATIGAAITTKGFAIAGTDGTNARILKTDASGELQVDVLTMPTVTVTGTIAATQSGTWNIATLTSITNSVTVVGAAASGASKSGNPVQIGGVFNTTQPTVTTGQAVEAQSSARGALIVATGVDAFAVNATLTAETTKVIGVVRNADGSGNLLTSTGNALDVNLKTSSITLPVSLASVPTHAVTIASGGVASGAYASGSIASGAYASGSIASGALASGSIAVGAIVAGAVAAGASSFVKLEDVASADADAGVPALAVRKATPANTSGTDGDYEFLQISAGRLWTSGIVTDIVPGVAATNLGKAEDAGHASGDTGVMALAVRNDTPAALAGTTLDYIPLTTDSTGRLWVNGGGAVTALTASSPTATSVGVASGSAVASNASRKGLVLTNTSSAFISLGLGATAVLYSGITLPPYGVWQMDQYTFTTGTINAISSLASSNLAVQELT